MYRAKPNKVVLPAFSRVLLRNITICSGSSPLYRGRSDHKPSKQQRVPRRLLAQVLIPEQKEPMGFPYFARTFKLELNHLKNYLETKKHKEDYTFDPEIFKKLCMYNKRIRNKEKMSLFLTTLKRNPNYQSYIVEQSFGIHYVDPEKVDRGSETVIIEEEEPVKESELAKHQENTSSETIGHLLQSEQKKTKPSPLRQEKGDSFKDLLSSINKVQKLDQHSEILPKMTNLTPMPTAGHSHNLNHLEFGADEKAFESFLQKAKTENDLKQDQLFKSELNYEWSKQQLSNHPRTLERRNFFTPVLLPNTLVPSNFFQGRFGTTVDLFPKFPLAEPKKEPSNFDFIVLHKDGSMEKLRSYSSNRGVSSERNIVNVMSDLKSPELYLKNINKLFDKRWMLFDGDSEKLVFTRKKSVKVYQWLKNAFSLLGVGFVTLFALSYYIDTDELKLLDEFKEKKQLRDDDKTTEATDSV